MSKDENGPVEDGQVVPVVDGKDINTGQIVTFDAEKLITAGGVALANIAAALVTGAAGSRRVPDTILNRHEIQVYQFRDEAQAKASFWSSLFSAQINSVSVGMMQEAKKFTTLINSETKEEYEFGVAVRLYAGYEAYDISSDMNPSLSGIAAMASLAQGKSAILFQVEGYSGEIGDMLPDPGELNVETFRSYVTAFEMIKKEVLGKAGAEHHAPVILTRSQKNIA